LSSMKNLRFSYKIIDAVCIHPILDSIDPPLPWHILSRYETYA
jgi:hypothetical protein